ncbi:MAG: PIN domain-containing protein [Anaerolineae bacterium]
MRRSRGGNPMVDGERLRIVLDTNIFVAAGFNRDSCAARILERLRDGEWLLVWDHPTRRETETILSRIPPLAGRSLTDLFRREGEWSGPTDPAAFSVVEDADDRKFAALAAAADAVLVTNDEHLLAHRGRLGIAVRTPRELLREHP